MKIKKMIKRMIKMKSKIGMVREKEGLVEKRKRRKRRKELSLSLKIKLMNLIEMIKMMMKI